jgi:adenylate kinase family enzyme
MNYDPDAVFRRFLNKIENLDHPNNKLYIAFSAVTASGKTRLAKRISEYYSGLYLSADDFRAATQELYPTISRPELEQFVVQFAPSIQNRLSAYPNHLHVVDSNIDQYAQQVIDTVKRIEYPLFVIRLDVNRSTLVNRIKNREQNKFQDKKTLLNSLDKNLRYHDEFSKNFGNFISYNYSYTKEGDLDSLLMRISEALKQHHSS